MIKFLNSIVSLFDSGKMYTTPIAVLYKVIAVLWGIVAIAVLTQLDELNQFIRMIGGGWGSDKTGFLFLLYIGFLAACIMAAYLWWKRAGQTAGEQPESGDRFVAIPIAAGLIRTAGESVGIIVAVFGAWVGLFGTIELGSHVLYLVIFAPIAGWVYAIIARGISELICALATIANNTSAINQKMPEPAAPAPEEEPVVDAPYEPYEPVQEEA